MFVYETFSVSRRSFTNRSRRSMPIFVQAAYAGSCPVADQLFPLHFARCCKYWRSYDAVSYCDSRVFCRSLLTGSIDQCPHPDVSADVTRQYGCVPHCEWVVKRFVYHIHVLQTLCDKHTCCRICFQLLHRTSDTQQRKLKPKIVVFLNKIYGKDKDRVEAGVDI